MVNNLLAKECSYRFDNSRGEMDVLFAVEIITEP